MTASDEMNETMNVDGTRNAVELAGQLEAGHFHQVSSVAASGDYRGVFDESMFDEGQRLPSPYHRTKFESEKIVREEATVPWRVYRPAIVVGDSETGAMDKIDGPYYFFPLLKRMRDTLPGWMPLVGVDLGDTNVVPVDYVAKAMDHIAHKPDLDGQAFHLVNPEPQNTVGLINTFAAAAKAPQFAVPVDRSVTSLVPTDMLPHALRPTALLGAALRTRRSTSRSTRRSVASASRRRCSSTSRSPRSTPHARPRRRWPDRASPCPTSTPTPTPLWSCWEEMLDDSIKNDTATVKALTGKTVVITGASSGIGLVTAVQVAKAGAAPILVARGGRSSRPPSG